MGLAATVGLLSSDADASVPQRQWGTYFGGDGAEYQDVIAVDEVGNIYLAGHTESAAQLASAGAFDDSAVQARRHCCHGMRGGFGRVRRGRVAFIVGLPGMRPVPAALRRACATSGPDVMCSWG